MSKKLFIVAGEPSGDLHASNLVHALREQNPAIEFMGMGGGMMREAGVDVVKGIDDMAVVGFVEVFRHLSHFKKVFYSILGRIEEERPDAVVLIDYPGFNLRLAKRVKQLGIPVIYYICPQVWAWHKSRVKQIRSYVDLVLAIFEFERNFFRAEDINAEFVGHPLLDVYKELPDREAARAEFGIDGGRKVIGIFPGSRQMELDNLLSRFLGAAAILKRDDENLEFLVSKAPSLDREEYDAFLAGRADFRLVEHKNPEIMAVSDFLMMASGTVALEAAIIGTPFLIAYRGSWLSYWIAWLLVDLDYVSLVNIIPGKEVVKEFIQGACTDEKLSRYIKTVLYDEAALQRMSGELALVRDSLRYGASDYAADRIIDFLDAL